MERALGVPIILDNDGTVAAVGESLYGVGRRSLDFAYLHLTNGFGGGLIIGGKPYRGQHGNAGEFGGIWGLVGHPVPNLDLLRQCVEENGAAFDTVEDMVQAIGASWPGVDKWLDIAAGPFSLLCDILAYAIDPQMVVLGGRLPRPIAEALVARVTMPRNKHRRGWGPPVPLVVAAEAEGDVVAVGGAAMVLRKAFFV